MRLRKAHRIATRVGAEFHSSQNFRRRLTRKFQMRVVCLGQCADWFARFKRGHLSWRGGAMGNCGQGGTRCPGMDSMVDADRRIRRITERFFSAVQPPTAGFRQLGFAYRAKSERRSRAARLTDRFVSRRLHDRFRSMANRFSRYQWWLLDIDRCRRCLSHRCFFVRPTAL